MNAKYYKYFSPSEQSLSALEQGELWFSSTGNLNDLNEGQENSGEITKALAELLKNGYTDNSELINRFCTKQDIEDAIDGGGVSGFFADMHFASIGSGLLSNRDSKHNGVNASLVTCFSCIPDSIKMWGQYADSHQGFCLGFSELTNTKSLIIKKLLLLLHCSAYKAQLIQWLLITEKFNFGNYSNTPPEAKETFKNMFLSMGLDSMKQSFDEGLERCLLVDVSEVEYVEAQRDLNREFAQEIYVHMTSIESTSKSLKELVRSIVKRATCIKSKDWEEEMENRIVIPDYANSGKGKLFAFDKAEVSSVLIGERCSIEVRERLKKIFDPSQVM